MAVFKLNKITSDLINKGVPQTILLATYTQLGYNIVINKNLTTVYYEGKLIYQYNINEDIAMPSLNTFLYMHLTIERNKNDKC